MGLLCDFFSASPERALSIDPDQWPEVANNFDVLPSGGIEPTVMLGVLEEVLVGTPFEETMDAAMRFGEGGECWIYSLRVPLQEALSAERSDWSTVAEQWIQTGEVGDADEEDMAEFLQELADFVRRSGTRGEVVHAWGSL